MPHELFPLILIAHIALALSLFLPSLLLPFAFASATRIAARRPYRAVRAAAPRAPVAQARSGSALGLAITGLALVVDARAALLEQPWLLVALAIYGMNLALAYFIQVPRLRQPHRPPVAAATRAGRTWPDGSATSRTSWPGSSVPSDS